MRYRNSSRRPRQWFRANARVTCLDLSQCSLFGTARLRVTAGGPLPVDLALPHDGAPCSTLDASGVSARTRVSNVAACPRLHACRARHSSSRVCGSLKRCGSFGRGSKAFRAPDPTHLIFAV
jgi:hypothetical protein